MLGYIIISHDYNTNIFYKIPLASFYPNAYNNGSKSSNKYEFSCSETLYSIVTLSEHGTVKYLKKKTAGK